MQLLQGPSDVAEEPGHGAAGGSTCERCARITLLLAHGPSRRRWQAGNFGLTVVLRFTQFCRLVCPVSKAPDDTYSILQTCSTKSGSSCGGAGLSRRQPRKWLAADL